MNIRRFFKAIYKICRGEVFGFISPSVDLTDSCLKECRLLLDSNDDSVVDQFENNLSDFLGGGNVVSFASGRMAFYSLLRCMGVGEGDEVALTGFTCSVMANAVLRIGAKPVYVDIDSETLGMSPKALIKCISEKTKVIVAQHTFGIPCEIDAIKDIAEKNNILLIEDCALSFGSSYKGKMLGNWGDAAVFSTDHTKPINTLIGGFAYSNNNVLTNELRIMQKESGGLSKKHQEVILRRYISEHQMSGKPYNSFILNNFLTAFLHKVHLNKTFSPFLVYESSAKTGNNTFYPYPAKMPSMLAFIGMKSLNEYILSIEKRKQRLRELILLFKEKEVIPQAYFDQERDIVPLRFVFMSDNREKYSFIDDWVWFKRPIVATVEPLEYFGYFKGACPIAEKVGYSIMNYPILLSERKNNLLIIKTESLTGI